MATTATDDQGDSGTGTAVGKTNQDKTTTADSITEMRSEAASQAPGSAQFSREHRRCPCVQQKTKASWATEASMQQEMQEAAAAISKELTVPTNNISSTIRKKTSAQDDRPSSTALGFVGAALCILPLVLVVVADVMKAVVCLFWPRKAGQKP